MSQINVNRIKDSNEGAPDFPSGVNVSGVTSTVTLGVTNLTATNVNVSGVVTATTLDGSLLATGTPTLGLGVTINASGVNISGVATAGIVSATTLYGDGSNLTGIGLSIAPLNYNPAVGGLIVGSGTGIGITFNQAVKAGSGNVTLRIAGAAGTVVENFGVGNSVTYSNGDTITITPTSSLSSKETYHLSYPSGAFTNIGGDVSYVGTAYTFITVGGQLWMWGYGGEGTLGQNNETKYSSPVQIPGNGWSVKMNASNGQYANAIKTDGTLWMWGKNDAGELGQNNKTKYSSPVQVPGTTWDRADCGRGPSSGSSTVAVKTDNTLWGWGSGAQGKLGLNDTRIISSPVQIPGTTWSQASTTQDFTLATKTDGTLWAWGLNEYGRLGLNQAHDTAISSPTQIPGTTWKFAYATESVCSAIKTDGTYWSWGYGGEGTLGLNDRTTRSSPTQVPGTTWSTTYGDARSGGRNSYGLKTDGTLWTWGLGDWGQLGVNDRAARSSPTQIPGTTWISASVNQTTASATKTDGTLWSWGYNPFGTLGQNNRTNYSSPTQVPGTWNRVGNAHGDSYVTMVHKEV